MYSIRLHKEFVESLDWLDQYGCFIVEESDANRIHYQGIVKYPNKIASLRALIKAKNPLMIGNKAYSVKQCKEEYDDLITYYCKGTKDSLPVVVKNTLLIDNINERYKLYYEVKLSREKRSKGSLYERVFDGCSDSLCNPDLVISHIVKYYIEQGKPINEYQIKSLALTYLCKNVEGYGVRLKNRLVSQLDHL